MATCPSRLEVSSLGLTRLYLCERPELHDGFHQSMALQPGHELARRIDPGEAAEPSPSVDVGAGWAATPTTDVVICWRGDGSR